MLNMSYSSLAGKRQCRIALGDRDMLVPVHQDFRCVVLQDEAKLPSADAAFLNRFEKHYVPCYPSDAKMELVLLGYHSFTHGQTVFSCVGI